MVAIKKQLAPVIALVNGYGYGNKKKFVTIHQTGNTSKGANAQTHANLQSRVYGASWHYQVDDKEAIQSFEHTVSCWHASDGRNDGNLNSIAIEGCINPDGNYIKAVTNMAELAAKILKDEGILIANMKQHHDFDTKNRKNCPAQIRAGKDGIDWKDFVNMVKGFMNDKPITTKPVIKVEAAVKKSIDQLAKETINGVYGSGDVRKKALGANFNAVQNRVNELLKVKVTVKTPAKTIQQLVNEVMAGKHGNGDARKNSLGSNYTAVMNVINGKAVSNKKSVTAIAKEVIAGKFGNGADRKKNVEKAGYNYNDVQKRVNQLL